MHIVDSCFAPSGVGAGGLEGYLTYFTRHTIMNKHTERLKNGHLDVDFATHQKDDLDINGGCRPMLADEPMASQIVKEIYERYGISVSKAFTRQ